MKKILVISVIILLVCLNIPNFTAKNIIENNITILEKQSASNNDILFNLKIKTIMKIGHMRSLSACIIKNNTIVWSKGYGFSDKLFLQRPTKDTMYLAGSITKSITATAIMQLYENGSYNFNLDDNVSKWLPFDLKNPKYPNINITFRMLLAHQSSLLGQGESELKYLFSDNPFSYIREIILPNGSEYHPEYWADYPPGSNFSYSNLGFIILGYIIEKMTNMSYEQYVQDKILKPLEMNNSGFNLSNLNKFNLAAPYVWRNGFYIRIIKFDYSFFDPCGGLFTTTEDLSHFLIAHLNGGEYKKIRILKKESIDMMHQVQYPNNSLDLGYRYGLGWFIQVDSNDEPAYLYHDGYLLYYSSLMINRISDNVSIIFFYNTFFISRKIFTNLSESYTKYARGLIDDLLFQKADSL